MFNLNFYKKKFRKILLSINKILESFFIELGRSKHSTDKSTPFKKKIIHLDHRIESFFDKFKNFKKFNQGKKNFYLINTKPGAFIALIIILFLTYFFIPAFYKKDDLKIFLINQISKKYDIDIVFNEKLNYGLFPKPYFYTKNLDITYDSDVFANSNFVKFYVKSKNFIFFKNIKVDDMVFQNTEFNINEKNKDFFKKTLNDFKNSEKVVFKKSRSFYKDKDENLLFLSKIKNITYFYDDKNKSQKVKSELEIFNVPFKLSIIKNSDTSKKKLELVSKKIRLNIETTIEYDNSNIFGDLKITFLSKDNSFKYTIKNESLNFLSDDKKFQGSLNFKPFYLSTNLSFNHLDQKKIFRDESLLFDLLESDLLNNPNLNALININVDKFAYMKDLFLQVLLDDGKIISNNFNVKWNDAVSINSSDIEFMSDQNGKKLVGEIKFMFDDIERFFRYFQIKRNYRDVFDEIKSDFIYDLVENKIILNNLEIDNVSFKKLNKFLEQNNKKDKSLFNKVTLRNFIKEFFRIYAG